MLANDSIVDQHKSQKMIASLEHHGQNWNSPGYNSICMDKLLWNNGIVEHPGQNFVEITACWSTRIAFWHNGVQFTNEARLCIRGKTKKEVRATWRACECANENHNFKTSIARTNGMWIIFRNTKLQELFWWEFIQNLQFQLQHHSSESVLQ